MLRIIVATIALALGASGLAGCHAPQGVPSGSFPSNYAPYDEQANPFCGVTGTCRPENDRPYPMRGNYGG
jgi:hypothetical protein